jgi:hypothetical protein
MRPFPTHRTRSLDNQVRERLRGWPQCPPGRDRDAAEGGEVWLRGRPAEEQMCQPFLKLPGSDRLRTLPDGLWLNFGGTPDEPYVDIFAIEACSSLPNFLDKRSRFAPSTHSLMAVCPLQWLMAPVMQGDATPRWKLTGVLRGEPTQAMILPVRDLRVMYGLTNRHYRGFVESHVPHPHEYFVPMDTLIAEDGDKNPELRRLVAQASTRANFWSAARV